MNKTDAVNILKPLLKNRKLSIFVGSGISNDPPSGLPTWDYFVDSYINICESLNKRLDPALRFDEVINDAKLRQNKDTVRTISVLKKK